jgi:small GTP-binding protein
VSRTTLNLGILAHVDAGKTTLTERLLYAAGVIDRPGSVDAGTTQTDSLALERQRGITIRSAVASFGVGDVTVNLIDTPGHPDFIAEVERVLSVLDGAVLVISAVEGVQPQTRILMRALRRLGIPALLFVNKIDRSGADPGRVLREISGRLGLAAPAMQSVRAAGTPGAGVTLSGADDLAFRLGLTELLAEQDEGLMAAYVAGEAGIGYGRLRAELAAQAARGLQRQLPGLTGGEGVLEAGPGGLPARARPAPRAVIRLTARALRRLLPPGSTASRSARSSCATSRTATGSASTSPAAPATGARWPSAPTAPGRGSAASCCPAPRSRSARPSWEGRHHRGRRRHHRGRRGLDDRHGDRLAYDARRVGRGEGDRRRLRHARGGRGAGDHRGPVRQDPELQARGQRPGLGDRRGREAGHRDGRAGEHAAGGHDGRAAAELGQLHDGQRQPLRGVAALGGTARDERADGPGHGLFLPLDDGARRSQPLGGNTARPPGLRSPGSQPTK